jgi:hypothetical protein
MPPTINTQTNAPPIEIDDSTMDFVFIGPYEGQQRLLARSRNLDLLLLGLARLSPHHLLERDHASSPNGAVARLTRNGNDQAVVLPEPKSIKGLFENDPEATLYSITALIPPLESPGSRAEPYVIAWIGRSQKVELHLIHEYFQNCAIPLAQAIGSENAREQVQWQIAPLLFLCARLTKARRKTNVMLRREALASAVLARDLESSSFSRRLMTIMPLMISMLMMMVLLVLMVFLVGKSLYP